MTDCKWKEPRSDPDENHHPLLRGQTSLKWHNAVDRGPYRSLLNSLLMSSSKTEAMALREKTNEDTATGTNRMFETFSSRSSRQGTTTTTKSKKGKKLITWEEYKRNKHSRRLAENHITDYGKEQMCRQIPEHYFRQKETVNKSHTKHEK